MFFEAQDTQHIHKLITYCFYEEIGDLFIFEFPFSVLVMVSVASQCFFLMHF